MENIKEYCKDWFKTNKINCPRYARDWKGVGKNIPPKTSLTALRSLGLKPADIINYVYEQEVAKTNKTHTLNYDMLGLVLLSTSPTGNGHTTVYYSCSGCGMYDCTDQGTLVRWQERGVKFCPTCRGSSGKPKTETYYQNYIGSNFNIYGREDNRTLKIQCLDCNFRFTRSIAQLQQKETENICCPNCYTEAKYIKGKAGKYGSLIEKELTEHIEPLIAFSTQVPYSSFLPTTRKFTADIYLQNTVIEITTKSNNLPNYSSRLKEKEELCTRNGISFHVVHTKKEIEDIVRSLLRDKEK